MSKCFVCNKEMAVYPDSTTLGYKEECSDHGYTVRQIKILQEYVSYLKHEITKKAVDYKTQMLDVQKYQQELQKQVEELEEYIDLSVAYKAGLEDGKAIKKIWHTPEELSKNNKGFILVSYLLGYNEVYTTCYIKDNKLYELLSEGEVKYIEKWAYVSDIEKLQ